MVRVICDFLRGGRLKRAAQIWAALLYDGGGICENEDEGALLEENSIGRIMHPLATRKQDLAIH